ncbi:hypothetical protein PG994_012676 [Apiospora phragmitis]|uniref:Uncharacterized protein n=1 Tax=Apiospora phragmitis TaxID=2905665 RepID=A0ABR1TB63_9PEZI
MALVRGLPISHIAASKPDPFYVSLPNISTYHEGELGRDRFISNVIKSGPASTYTAGRVYQYMYRSRDSNDNPVATLITPPSTAPTDNRKLLSYAIAYDSPNPDCVPSCAIRPDTPAPAGAFSVDAMQRTILAV